MTFFRRSFSARVAVLAVAASVACSVAAQPTTADPTAATVTPTYLLILPSRQSLLSPPAETMRQGFFAAHKAAGGDGAIQVVEVDDDPNELNRVLAAARERGVKVAIGPLPRSAVNAIVETRQAVLPMVTLNYPDWDTSVPASTIVFGLSAEAEAQRVTRIALAEFVGVRRADARTRMAVIVGSSALERRIGQAFVSALRGEGEVPIVIDASGESVNRISAQLAAVPSIEAVFLALDARNAAQLRARIPRPVLIFATSLVNAGDPKTSPSAAALAHDLDGVRFVDMPWILQPDHPAVMVYPKPDVPLAVDGARLYALGIDAFRIATAWSKGETKFDLDGVTGRLRLDRPGGPRVDRSPSSAIFRNGAIEREEIAR